ncbi:MAG: helix-turn-helix transcriptional regulator, partial [Lentisphaeria bacterium]|nr:helix-turn-helix transcriptional regulator [Lentisphaeria bacterium]
GWNNDSYCEDCINFCGPVADMLMRSGVLTTGVFHMGRIRKVLPILEYASSPSLDSQIKANIELQKLLTDIYFESRKHFIGENTLLDELLQNIQSDPEKWWSVKEMADMCNLSVDQMRRIFVKKTGLLPKIYIDRQKLTCAADFLLHSRCSIREVAEKFGYRDQYHFSRRFKALMGLSPLTYRKKVGSINPLAVLPEENGEE